MHCEGDDMGQKIVLRMKDGSMKKCSTHTHFSAAYRHIKVVTMKGEVETVALDDVKAIFFVKAFEGDPGYKAGREFTEDSPKAGQAVCVTFGDGEIIRGRVLNMAEERQGFFLFPADPRDNNEKVYVVRAPDARIEVET
jgi:hypothetical protein